MGRKRQNNNRSIQNMKHAPSNHSKRQRRNNQKTAICYSEKQEQRQQAIETAKLFDTLQRLKNKPIKYDINRKPLKL